MGKDDRLATPGNALDPRVALVRDGEWLLLLVERDRRERVGDAALMVERSIERLEPTVLEHALASEDLHHLLWIVRVETVAPERVDATCIPVQ